MSWADRIRASVSAALFGPPAAASTANAIYRQVAVSPYIEWMAGVPDPDEVLRRTGRTRANLRELHRDAELDQALDTRKEAVLATPWRLEPYASRAEKLIYAELEPRVTALVAGMWDAVPYGYSVLEAVYTRRAGRIGIDAVYAPPFEWFMPQPGGGLRFFPQDGSGGVNGIACDPRKFVLSQRNATYRNPYGEALLSPLYWPVTWRMQGWQLWLNFLETFGSPIVIGQTADYNAFVAAMVAQGITRTVGWQGNAATDKITTVTGSAPGEFARLEDALAATIQKLILGQTLTSQVGDTGSFAAAKVHNEVRDDKRRADLRIVCGGMQQLIDALWLLNAFPGGAPRFVMQDDTGLEAERAARDVQLYAIGWRPTEDYLLARYDFDEGDFTIAAEQPAPQPGNNTPPAVTPSTVKEKQAALALLRGGRFTPKQQEVEDAVAAALEGDVPVPITPDELRSAIAAATSPHDLAERLAVLIDKQNPAYQELLARAQFAAAVLGYVHATTAPASA